MRTLLCGLGFAATVLLGAASLQAGEDEPNLVADYQFQDTLESAVEGAPNIINLGNNTFRDVVVDGAEVRVLDFAKDNGLSLATGDVLPSGEQYSIVVLFRFTEIDAYRRICDFQGGTRDSGLYNLSGNLVFYSVASGADGLVEADEFVQVVLTRDADGNVVGYVDGDEQFSFNDAGGEGSLDASDTLRFFVDDKVFPNETSAGSVARIRIYDGPLTAEEVEELDRLPE